MTWGKAARGLLLAFAAIVFAVAIFVWFNVDLGLSSAYFSGEDLRHARSVWFQINLMLGFVLLAGIAVVAWLGLS
jgi:hypothetical protein